MSTYKKPKSKLKEYNIMNVIFINVITKLKNSQWILILVEYVQGNYNESEPKSRGKVLYHPLF